MRNERLNEYVAARFSPAQCLFLETLAGSLGVTLAESLRLIVNEAMERSD